MTPEICTQGSVTCGAGYESLLGLTCATHLGLCGSMRPRIRKVLFSLEGEWQGKESDFESFIPCRVELPSKWSSELDRFLDDFPHRVHFPLCNCVRLSASFLKI